jgi:Tol biopolymer transport system component
MISAGTRLGPYEIVGPLGAGGMGEVYRARDARLNRDVAIKVLPERVSQDADALARFEREAKSVAGLSHPNILALHDIGRQDGVVYAVMELLEGETLREALASGPLAPRTAVAYATQIALGLAAAHEKGIVHRDIKPDNAFVTPDERVKILDFGLAKSAGAAVAGPETESPTVSGYTEPGKVMGTVGYMSPEQVRGLAVDQRSDIFSFGSLLYEMLAGRRPFQHETAAETMTAILKEEPDLDTPDLRIPPSLRPVLRHCLEKKPERRFQSARDLAFALETASAPATAASGVAAAIPEPPARTQGSLGRSLGVAALVVAAAAAGYLAHSRRAAQASAPAGWEEATYSLLTTDPGYEAEPTFSPDGRTIAYVADREGNFEIYLQQISGGPAINLTHNAAADVQPAFSPDGREIAFVSDRAGTSEIFHAAPGLPRVGGDIWVMPALGGTARRVVENGYFPSWTPDGSAILYVHGVFRKTRIARVPATGGESRDVPIDEPAVARYFFPRVSDDGRWLMYQNGVSVEVVAASGGKPRVLSQGEYPAWGAGSRSILYTSGATGKSRTLWEAPFSGERGELSGPPRPLTLGGGEDVGAAASRDGTTIAYAALNATLNLEDVGFDADAGKVVGTPRELTSGENHVGLFDPAPDGKAVVYAAGTLEGSRIWRAEFGSLPVELSREPGFMDANPSWSPDGRSIAFFRSPVGHFETGNLWMMNADGTSPHRVTEMDGLGQASWLPDGKSMLISRERAVLNLDLASGKTTPVAGIDGRALFVVDAQGEWIAFQTIDGGPMHFAAMPIGGGTPRVVIAAGDQTFHPFFSPSGRWLYFQKNHKNLFRIPGPKQDWRSASPEQVTAFTGPDLYIDGPKTSADGSRLFYARGRTTGGIVIVQRSKPARQQ